MPKAIKARAMTPTGTPTAGPMTEELSSELPPFFVPPGLEEAAEAGGWDTGAVGAGMELVMGAIG